MSFPEDFIFGVATAAYQIEGGWNENGKGENIWDHLTHKKPSPVVNGDTGDVACDSYHQYQKDVALIKDIGFKIYRFSISWSRILPNGEITLINEDGVNYYRALITELLKNDIEPMVTIYHWDLPQRLQDTGGWANPLIADYAEDYADLLFSLYGDMVKWWITINEPLQMTWGYQGTEFAPALNLGSSISHLIGHNILRAHGRIFRLYDKKYRSSQRGKLSIGLCARGFLPKTDCIEDKEAAERSLIFELGWFAHPIYSKNGDYPAIMREVIDTHSKNEGRRRSRLPTFTEKEIEAIKGSYDFFSINHYTSFLASPGQNTNLFFAQEDIGVHVSYDSSWAVGPMKWLKVVPQGMRELLRYVKDNYGNPPVFITENGYCTKDNVNDTDRIFYHRDYLTTIANAIHDDHCQVIGYSAWCLLDSFEWKDGYGPRFGLIRVDFEDPKRKRTPKLSAKFFQQLLKTHSIPNGSYDEYLLEKCIK